MSVEPIRALTRRGARVALLAVVATLTLAGSQAMVAAPALAQGQARRPRRPGTFPASSHRRCPRRRRRSR